MLLSLSWNFFRYKKVKLLVKNIKCNFQKELRSFDTHGDCETGSEWLAFDAEELYMRATFSNLLEESGSKWLAFDAEELYIRVTFFDLLEFSVYNNI